MFGGGDGRVERAVLRRFERLGLELHDHARRAVDEQGDAAPGVRRFLARERGVRIRERDGKKGHAEQEDEKRRVANDGEVRAAHDRQDRGQRHERPAGLLRPQAPREQHQHGDRDDDDQHEHGDPRLIEMEIARAQRQPFVDRVADGVEELSYRDHAQPISVA